MPRIVVQARVVEVVQEEVIRYDCDFCGAECGTRTNNKVVVDHGTETYYFCKKSGCWGKWRLARFSEGRE